MSKWIRCWIRDSKMFPNGTKSGTGILSMSKRIRCWIRDSVPMSRRDRYESETIEIIEFIQWFLVCTQIKPISRLVCLQICCNIWVTELHWMMCTKPLVCNFSMEAKTDMIYEQSHDGTESGTQILGKRIQYWIRDSGNLLRRCRIRDWDSDMASTVLNPGPDMGGTSVPRRYRYSHGPLLRS